ncbi:ankyrin repeat-containing domain protein [Aspergillus navahoensis]
MASRRTKGYQNPPEPPPRYRPPSPAPSYRTLDIRIRESLTRPRVGLTGRILDAIVPRTRGRDARAATESHHPARRDAGVIATDSPRVNARIDEPVAAHTKGTAGEAAHSKAPAPTPPGPKRTEAPRPVETKRKKREPPKTASVYTETEIKAFEIVGAKVRSAIQRNDGKLLSMFLEEKYNWNTPLHDGSRLLHVAAELGRRSILMCLLERKVDVLVEDADGATPLLTAIRNGHTTVVEILVDAEADWRGIPSSSLELAAERGDEDMVNALLHFINPRHENGRRVGGCELQVGRALRIAAEQGHRSITTILYNHTSMLPNKYVDNKEFSLIYSAIHHGWPEILERILARFARDGTLHKVADNPTFLVSAASQGNTEIITQLLRAGIPVNCNNGYKGRGQYPLHGAACVSQVEAVRVLLEWGADPNLLTAVGENALNAAMCGGAPLEIIRMLLERGVDIHVKDLRGKSPYEDAQTDIWGYDGELLELMKEYGYVDGDGNPSFAFTTDEKKESI